KALGIGRAGIIYAPGRPHLQRSRARRRNTKTRMANTTGCSSFLSMANHQTGDRAPDLSPTLRSGSNQITRAPKVGPLMLRICCVEDTGRQYFLRGASVS